MKCPNCGIGVPEMPEDAKYDECLCNTCYEREENRSMSKFENILENWINGNISDATKAAKALSKKDLALFVLHVLDGDGGDISHLYSILERVAGLKG